MGIGTGLLSILGLGRKVENPLIPLTGDLLRSSLNSPMAGDIDVSPDCGAMQIGVIFAAIRAISETIASFPCIVYRRDGDDGRDRDSDDPLYGLLHDRPNESMTPFTFWDVVVKRMIRKGNAYAYIERNGGGKVVNLVLLDNAKMKVSIVGGAKAFAYDGKSVDPSEILHFVGFSDDGMVGLPLLVYAWRTLSLTVAAEEHGADYFRNGSIVNGVVELSGMPTPDQLKTLKGSFAEAHQGQGKQHGIPFIPGGSFKNISNSNEASQFVETRKFQTIECCRLLRIPPHIIQDLERATFTNIEAQGREFLQLCVRPWLIRMEQELKLKLCDGDQFVEFLVDALLRADTQTRYTAYQIGRTGGWLSPNEIRAMENLPPRAGGDDYAAPPNAPGEPPKWPDQQGGARPNPQQPAADANKPKDTNNDSQK